MMLPIKAICRTKKIRRDGTSLIFFQYCYNTTQRTLLNTGFAIPVNFWNKKQCCISEKLPTSIGDHEKLNDELNRQKRIAEDLMTYTFKNAITNKGVFVKQTFCPTLDIATLIITAVHLDRVIISNNDNNQYLAMLQVVKFAEDSFRKNKLGLLVC